MTDLSRIDLVLLEVLELANGRNEQFQQRRPNEAVELIQLLVIIGRGQPTWEKSDPIPVDGGAVHVALLGRGGFHPQEGTCRVVLGWIAVGIATACTGSGAGWFGR